MLKICKRLCLVWVLLLSLTSCDMNPVKDPLIIGHRGAMGYETENTIASIEKALDLGVAMVEIDVFQIASGELVVFHDDDLERLTGVKGAITNYSWQALSELRVEGGHAIPLLSEVLAVLEGKAALNIELKGPHTALPVLELLKPLVAAGRWSLEDLIISSFNWPLLLQTRIENSSIPIAVLTEENPLDAIEMARSVQAIAINPYFKDIDATVVAALHKAGYKVFPWTVNEPADLAAMKAMKVDGVFTNFPDRKF